MWDPYLRNVFPSGQPFNRTNSQKSDNKWIARTRNYLYRSISSSAREEVSRTSGRSSSHERRLLQCLRIRTSYKAVTATSNESSRS